MTEVSKTSFRILKRFGLGAGVIAEVGEIRDDIPVYAVSSLRYHGKIEAANAKGAKAPKAAAESISEAAAQTAAAIDGPLATPAAPEPAGVPLETPEATAVPLKKRGRPPKNPEGE